MAIYKTGSGRHSVQPALNLDFANSKELDPRITFNRNSIATYYDNTGVLQYANYNQPRFDHDPETGESKGLLVEEESTNFFEYTGFSDGNASYWNIQGYTGGSAPIVRYNDSIAPDGTYTALYASFDNSADPAHRSWIRRCSPSTNAFTDVTISVWLKSAIGVDQSLLWHYGGNLGYSFTVTPEWQRYNLSLPSTDGNANLSYCWGIEGPVSDSAQVHMWGFQIETKLWPTTFIPSHTTFRSRSSEATYHDESGVLRTAPPDTPRYGHKYDGRKWISAGLLLENSSNNKFINSTNFNLTWPSSFQNAEITYGSGVNPDNSVAVQRLTATGDAVSCWMLQNTSVTDQTYYTTSVYAKAGTTNTVLQISPSTGFSSSYQNFDLENGTLGSDDLPSTYYAHIEDVGNGWYRCSVSGYATSSTIGRMVIAIVDGVSSPRLSASNLTGDHVHVWGAQFEANVKYPTSFIYTFGSNRDRDADVSTSEPGTRARDYAIGYDVHTLMPDVNQSNIDFTLYGDLQGIAHNNGFQQAIYLEDTSDSGNMYVTLFSAYAGNNTIASSYNINSVARNFGNWTSTESDISLRWKIAMGIEENNSRAAANGVLGSSAAGYWNGGGTFDRFYIGNGYQGGRYFNGWIRKISYYDKRLSNDELVALTENN